MNERESILSKLDDSFHDMDAHYYFGYTDESDRLITLTVRELKWLYEHLGGENEYDY